MHTLGAKLFSVLAFWIVPALAFAQDRSYDWGWANAPDDVGSVGFRDDVHDGVILGLDN